jgi:CheY-like chemotaxis protein
MAASQGTILIVDDDSDTASVLAEALCRRGFATSWVCSARECLDHLAHEAVDVVVTDIQMPESSGI